MIHVHSLSELPAKNVVDIYSHGYRMWRAGRGEVYYRMMSRAMEELQRRAEEAMQCLRRS